MVVLGRGAVSYERGTPVSRSVQSCFDDWSQEWIATCTKNQVLLHASHYLTATSYFTKSQQPPVVNANSILELNTKKCVAALKTVEWLKQSWSSRGVHSTSNVWLAPRRRATARQRCCRGGCSLSARFGHRSGLQPVGASSNLAEPLRSEEGTA